MLKIRLTIYSVCKTVLKEIITNNMSLNIQLEFNRLDWVSSTGDCELSLAAPKPCNLETWSIHTSLFYLDGVVHVFYVIFWMYVFAHSRPWPISIHCRFAHLCSTANIYVCIHIYIVRSRLSRPAAKITWKAMLTRSRTFYTQAESQQFDAESKPWCLRVYHQ